MMGLVASWSRMGSPSLGCAVVGYPTEPKVRGSNPLGRAPLLAQPRTFSLQTRGFRPGRVRRVFRPSPLLSQALQRVLVAKWSQVDLCGNCGFERWLCGCYPPEPREPDAPVKQGASA
jgi:hypothetical protein